MRPSTRRLTAGIAVALLATIALSQAAAAGGPRQRIAFTRLDETGATVVTTNPDGSDERVVPLGDPVEEFGVPVWSPDRSRLLISHTIRFDPSGELLPFRPAIVQPDGSDYRLLTIPGAPFDTDCTAWSKDATRLFCSLGGDEPGVFSVRSSDGGGARRLTTNPFEWLDMAVDVSPDGKQVLVMREQPGAGPDPNEDETFALYTVRIDGTHLRLLTPYGVAVGDEIGSAHWSPDGRTVIAGSPDGRLLTVDVDTRRVRYLELDIEGYAFNPNFSPDGSRIVFGLFGPEQEDLYTADRKGSNVRPVTDTPAFEHGADWR